MKTILLTALFIRPAELCRAEIRLEPNTTITLATIEEGLRILESRDDFIRRMSPFDRAARMKTDKDVSEKQYLAFAGENVLAWNEAEMKKVETAFLGLQPLLARWFLLFPKKIFIIKTTGKEEGQAAYTRSDAIILPVEKLAVNGDELQQLICHELFHILSRTNPKLREELYAAIGFVRCDELEFPAALKSRKITNPDASANDHYIRLEIDGQAIWAIPVLFSRAEKYDVKRGSEFFDYLEFRFLAVERLDDSTHIRIITEGSEPKLLDISQIKGFFEQVGRNTEYIIHPEEILADNFALLVRQNKKATSPEILKAIENILKKPESPL
jgi:hypothetical protein